MLRIERVWNTGYCQEGNAQVESCCEEGRSRADGRWADTGCLEKSGTGTIQKQS